MVQREQWDTYWGAKKVFFKFAILTTRRWNSVNLWPGGLPGVALGRYSTCANAYAACAGAPIGGYISGTKVAESRGSYGSGDWAQ
jgi:hypothetical protein